MLSIDDIKFDVNGLVPAVVVDDETKKILMLAYMSKDSLKISLEKKLTCFWSRSRKELWLKGSTSGNYQHIKKIKADCDRDTLLIYVKPDGPACHLGNNSCFVDDLFVDNENEAGNNISKHDENLQDNNFSIKALFELIKDRKINPPEKSYTSYLFEKGLDKILKKIGEESTEVVIAAKNSKEETIYEISDLIYHLLVLMVEAGISTDEILNELASRHVIDKKIKQEKMK